ncbi:MAG: hypothetical protein WCW67_06035 [Candidatus Margulisiibacteriota bacterium]|jgi:hypothetical protein
MTPPVKPVSVPASSSRPENIRPFPDGSKLLTITIPPGADDKAKEQILTNVTSRYPNASVWVAGEVNGKMLITVTPVNVENSKANKTAGDIIRNNSPEVKAQREAAIKELRDSVASFGMIGLLSEPGSGQPDPTAAAHSTGSGVRTLGGGNPDDPAVKAALNRGRLSDRTAAPDPTAAAIDLHGLQLSHADFNFTSGPAGIIPLGHPVRTYDGGNGEVEAKPTGPQPGYVPPSTRESHGGIIPQK